MRIVKQQTSTFLKSLPLLLLVVVLLGLLWFFRSVQQNNVKSLARQIADLKQQINALPATVAPEDRLTLEKDRLTLEKDRVNAENAIYGTLVQAFGGTFFVVTAYLTWRNVKATEEKQVTERFSKAVELLGNEKLQVRLGGIYALERIAKDSKNDYWSIMEVLTGYMREESPWVAGKEREKFPTDLQAILTIIGRRKQAWGKGKEHLIDLSGTDLRLANFIGDGFQGVNFTGANFKNTNLDRANFQGADFTVAQLQGASLEGANLTEADFQGANLTGARLLDACLAKAVLQGTNLSKTWDLDSDQVKRAEFWEEAIYDEDFKKELGLPTESGDGRQNG